MTGKEESALREAARVYLDHRMGKPGGLRQGLEGTRLKIVPGLLGLGKKFSWLSLLRLLVQLLLFTATAGFPVVVRKATASSGAPLNASDPAILASGIYSRWDQIDTWLFCAAIVVAGLPRIIEKFSRRSFAKDSPHISAHHLANALDDSPFSNRQTNGSNVQSAIDHALQALLLDLRDLIEESAIDPITEVTLLEFCGQGGSLVRVKSRSVLMERRQNERMVESWRFLAYYVAQRGNWYAEHNFLSVKNPFPKKRLTVTGDIDVGYSSVLYLPINRSRKDGQGQVVDECLGVICVHSKSPYRFWQWGDHKQSYGKFGNVAYNKALPYISLVGRLLVPTAKPLIVEKR